MEFMGFEELCHLTMETIIDQRWLVIVFCSVNNLGNDVKHPKLEFISLCLTCDSVEQSNHDCKFLLELTAPNIP